MHGRSLFEYAVIRIVPKVEREEFFNAGVVIFCKDKKFLGMQYTLNEKKLLTFSDNKTVDEIKQSLASFNKICCAASDGGPIAKLDLASRFRWLTSTRSTIVQTSKVHPGFCEDPAETLLRLHNQLVL